MLCLSGQHRCPKNIYFHCTLPWRVFGRTASRCSKHRQLVGNEVCESCVTSCNFSSRHKNTIAFQKRRVLNKQENTVPYQTMANGKTLSAKQKAHKRKRGDWKVRVPNGDNFPTGRYPSIWSIWKEEKKKPWFKTWFLGQLTYSGRDEKASKKITDINIQIKIIKFPSKRTTDKETFWYIPQKWEYMLRIAPEIWHFHNYPIPV